LAQACPFTAHTPDRITQLDVTAVKRGNYFFACSDSLITTYRLDEFWHDSYLGVGPPSIRVPCWYSAPLISGLAIFCVSNRTNSWLIAVSGTRDRNRLIVVAGRVPATKIQ
jgi:hypothetical protein